ncbi:MAG TPA: alpha/beta fold hydrolase [Candidatus Limnocylindrales bacterium]|nr:alpha/beta fold hydrolase [Candidatus Limnocylindrales bacterium]
MLFIQGGGANVHDEWDEALVASLRAALGDGFDVRYPRMPAEHDPSAATWVPAIRDEVAALDEGAAVVGHSVGGTLLMHTLVQAAPPGRLGAIVLVATPFVGEGGWPPDEFELPSHLGSRLPPGVPVHLFHGLEDDTVPPAHADLYARAIPGAEVHRLPGRDHQLGNDPREVATLIRGLDHSVGW